MRIGLTGGVGCGVSEVAHALDNRGIPVISADKIGHQVLTRPDVKRALSECFGHKIFDTSGEIDRKRLGELIFTDKEARQDLNRMVHPVLLDVLKAEVQQREAEYDVIVVDAALIFEWGLQGFFHKVIVVDAPREVRIQRIMKRDGLSRKQVEQRIAAQWPLEKKVAAADITISNHGTLDDLRMMLDEVGDEILSN